MVGMGRPKVATIRAGGSLWIGPALLALGTQYRARGCTTPAAGKLIAFLQRPRAYYVDGRHGPTPGWSDSRTARTCIGLGAWSELLLVTA